MGLVGRFDQARIQEMADQVPKGHIPRSMALHIRGELTRQVGCRQVSLIGRPTVPERLPPVSADFSGGCGERFGDLPPHALHRVQGHASWADGGHLFGRHSHKPCQETIRGVRTVIFRIDSCGGSRRADWLIWRGAGGGWAVMRRVLRWMHRSSSWRRQGTCTPSWRGP